MEAVRLTAAQALVRWLIAQCTLLRDGTPAPLFGGVFAIFGHGNVLGLGTALTEHRAELPVWRGHNEQGMALAAVGYAKATDRRQTCAVTSSIGPGALNMVTAAGVAHANRLPVLLLPGDTFVNRAPDPVLQQIEPFGDATATVNDAFRAVSRYFDRITRPEQLISSLPQVARVLTDPADCGPATLALPQDVQAEVAEFPVALFEPVVHRPVRPRPARQAVRRAAEAIRGSRRPLLVLGGGVRYSGAAGTALRFAERHGIPVTETTAGRTLVPHDHPLHAGPLGITGSASANTLAGKADLVLAVGTRLQDFTTASWSVFAPSVHLVQVNTARFDAVKHGAVELVADAEEALRELADPLVGWRADEGWTAGAATERAGWDGYIDGLRAVPATGSSTGPSTVLSTGASVEPATAPTYAQVVGVVNEASGPDDYVLTASGGLPGELVGGWRATAGSTGPSMDVEYGFSCMGYEVAGAWGAAMARAASHPDGVVTTLVGDGSYLMLNSELYSAAFTGTGFVAVLCDNDGYAVIDRLQRGNGAEPFNNMYPDCRSAHTDPPRVDFASHAAALGCAVLAVTEPAGLRSAYRQAREHARAGTPAVVVIRTHPSAWTDAGAWWEVGVPQYAQNPAVTDARHALDKAKANQVRYLSRPSDEQRTETD